MQFLVTVEVKKASGWQQFTVDADNEDAAIQRVRDGGGEFHEEELHVDQLAWPSASATAYQQ